MSSLFFGRRPGESGRTPAENLAPKDADGVGPGGGWETPMFPSGPADPSGTPSKKVPAGRRLPPAPGNHLSLRVCPAHGHSLLSPRSPALIFSTGAAKSCARMAAKERRGETGAGRRRRIGSLDRPIASMTTESPPQGMGPRRGRVWSCGRVDARARVRFDARPVGRRELA
jgi:hypothetical protein